jgi:hypothetical protein
VVHHGPGRRAGRRLGHTAQAQVLLARVGDGPGDPLSGGGQRPAAVEILGLGRHLRDAGQARARMSRSVMDWAACSARSRSPAPTATPATLASAQACVYGLVMDRARASARAGWPRDAHTAGSWVGMWVLRSASWSRCHARRRAASRSGERLVLIRAKAAAISARAAASPPTSAGSGGSDRPATMTRKPAGGRLGRHAAMLVSPEPGRAAVFVQAVDDQHQPPPGLHRLCRARLQQSAPQPVPRRSRRHGRDLLAGDGGQLVEQARSDAHQMPCEDLEGEGEGEGSGWGLPGR